MKWCARENPKDFISFMASSAVQPSSAMRYAATIMPVAVVAQAAMHKNFLAFVFIQNLQKFRKHLILRPRTVPRDGHIFHTQATYHFFFAGVIGMRVDHNVDAHLRQRLKAGG